MRTKEQHQQLTLAASPDAGRALAHRALLGADYAYASRSGMLDIFYGNALVHILSGELRAGQNGPVPSGFHHEPSASAIWGSGSAAQPAPTRVLLSESGAHPADENPMLPYSASVVIGGIRRTSLRRRNNKTEIVPAKNTMYPREYTAFDVIGAIQTAYENRDMADEELHIHPRVGPRVESFGVAPIGIGDSVQMGVRLVLDFDSLKIITAVPQLAVSNIGMNIAA